MKAISRPVVQLVVATLGGIGRHSLAQLRDPPGGKEQSVLLPAEILLEEEVQVLLPNFSLLTWRLPGGVSGPSCRQVPG